MESVPATASEHPATGKFDFPLFHPSDLPAWRAWLEAHHDTERGVWVLTWRPESGQQRVPYEDLVLEALCFGWIDSTAKVLDEERGMQLMTPRKAKSSWTRLNRQRVADMEAAGRMTDAGRRAVEVAQENGYWTLYDSVEDLIEPVELAVALDGSPDARRHWDEFPPSARKGMLWWIVSAAKPETKATRIAKIVDEAAEGRRAQG